MLNPYLVSSQTSYEPTRSLYEGMIIECIQITGQNYYYIPRTLSDRLDNVFGEDVLSSFDSYAEIEAYLDDTEGFGGEGNMLSKFGLEVRATATFIVSRTRYTETVVPIVPANRNAAVRFRPNEGDLIYAPFSKSLFEIKFIEDEAPGFYQLQKKYVWCIRCELVQLNNENFNTGIDVLDTTFGQNIDRLNSTVTDETGFTILLEDGGVVLTEDYDISKKYDDHISYGDNSDIKKEFIEIMNFDKKNPFNELF